MSQERIIELVKANPGIKQSELAKHIPSFSTKMMRAVLNTRPCPVRRELYRHTYKLYPQEEQ